MAAADENNVISAMKVHPKYLQSNATSHTWPLAAFAELIDNAFDAKAKEVQIDQLTLQNTRCLSFQDDGRGMDADHLHNMLSFGYSEAHERHHVGMYGNGFKSGSMRLGKDTIVFTRTAESAGIGLLSQSYLRAIDAVNVLVPMLHYKFPGFDPVKQCGREANLGAILEYSPFKQEEELISQLRAFPGTGTLILIYNLCRVDKYDRIELDFTSDPHDIRCPYICEGDHEGTVSYRNSLKQYCSILYLHPRMKIKIRGVHVKTRLIEKCLRHAQVDSYQPKGESKAFKITFGQVADADASGDYGIMFYRDNRLIKPYEKVTCQKQNDGVGLGIVGVTDAGFLTPTHNKQDFVRDEKFLAAMISYSKKLKNYWTIIHDTAPVSSSEDTDWVQCDNKDCLKWRRLPYGYDTSTLPEKWYCHLHPNDINCSFPEDVHSAGEQVKKVRQNRRASDTTRRLKSKRQSVDATAELNGKSGKQAKMSNYLQLEPSRAGDSGQGINSAGPTLRLAITPSCSSAALSGEASSCLSIPHTVGQGSSLATDGQLALGSDSSLEVLSSGQADRAFGSSVVGTDESCHSSGGDCSTEIDHSTGLDTSSRGDHSTGLDTSSRGDHSTEIDHSTGLDTSSRGDHATVEVQSTVDLFTVGDYSAGFDTSSRGDHSTGLDTSSRRNNATVEVQSTVDLFTVGDYSTGFDTSSRGDHSTGVDCFTGGDHCNGLDSSAGEDNSTGGDSCAKGGHPNGYPHSAREDNSTGGDSFVRGANTVDGKNCAESEHSTSSEHHTRQLDKFGSFVTRQNGDYSEQFPAELVNDGSNKIIRLEPANDMSATIIKTEPANDMSATIIKTEPANDMSATIIKTEPADDMPATIIKTEPANDMSATIIKTEPAASSMFLEDPADGVVEALGPGESEGVETVEVPGQQMTVAASRTKTPVGNTKAITDLQRMLAVRDRQIHHIQNQLQKFRNSVRQLLRRLAPDVDIGDGDNIEQLVENMLVADIDDSFPSWD